MPSRAAVTEHGTADEIGLAAATIRALGGSVPYSVLAGNGGDG
ncbi:hypothetical protein [Streptomyces sp. WAC 06738]|nr:hypothetical protein [Streptomyces sp. WAC 06738]